jgi:hypothetical protein
VLCEGVTDLRRNPLSKLDFFCFFGSTLISGALVIARLDRRDHSLSPSSDILGRLELILLPLDQRLSVKRLDRRLALLGKDQSERELMDGLETRS